MPLLEGGALVVFDHLEMHPRFKSWQVPFVEFRLVDALVGEFPDALFSGQAGPDHAEDPLLAPVPLDRRGLVVIDGIGLDGLLVDLHPQAGLVGHRHVPVHHLDPFGQQVGFPEFMAGDVGQLGVRQHRSDMGGESRGQPGAYHLKPEWLVQRGRHDALPYGPRGAAADHEAVADLRLPHVVAEVFHDGLLDAFAEHLRALEIFPQVEGAFVHTHVDSLVELRQDLFRFGLGEEKPVEIHVEPVVGRYGFAHRVDLGDDVAPGPRLHLEGSVAASEGLFRLLDPVFGRHVDVPPRKGAAVPQLVAQQGVHGHPGVFSAQVEDGDLRSEPDIVVPHDGPRVLADQTGGIRGAVPVGDADQAVVGLQPVYPHALVMGVGPGHGVIDVWRVKGHVECGSFGVRDLHGILLRWYGTGQA